MLKTFNKLNMSLRTGALRRIAATGNRPKRTALRRRRARREMTSRLAFFCRSQTTSTHSDLRSPIFARACALWTKLNKEISINDKDKRGDRAEARAGARPQRALPGPLHGVTPAWHCWRKFGNAFNLQKHKFRHEIVPESYKFQELHRHYINEATEVNIYGSRSVGPSEKEPPKVSHTLRVQWAK